MWAWEFPSVWRYVASEGATCSRRFRMSRRTFGSAFSLMVTAAVVWGMNTLQTPLITPLSRTTRRTCWVMSIICWVFSVFTMIVLNAMSELRSGP